MATAASPSSHACFSLPTITPTATAMSWWRRSVGPSIVAGAIGAAMFGSAALIEVMRAWTTALKQGAEVSQVVGGLVVALLVVAAFGLALRMRALGGVAVAGAFALLAHGGTLVLSGSTVGALFLGLAPLVAMLTNVALARPTAMVTTSWEKKTTAANRKTAPVVRRAASRIPLSMRASQVTIIDG